jgi:ATP synthase protein I
VLGQAVMTGVVAAVSYALGGPMHGVSALLGGGISTLASLAMTLLAFRGSVMADGQRALGAFYGGEAVKLAIVIVSFVVVLKTMKVAPLPMLAAYMATFIVHWIVLAGMVRAGK